MTYPSDVAIEHPMLYSRDTSKEVGGDKHAAFGAFIRRNRRPGVLSNDEIVFCDFNNRKSTSLVPGVHSEPEYSHLVR
jgi:hypothetical protein